MEHSTLLELSERDPFVKPDEKDREIAERRLLTWDMDIGPRVGDYVITPDGRYLRFAYRWPEGLQTTKKEGSGSFYLADGYMDMSGSLDPTIPFEQIESTSERKSGYCWIFHNDIHRAQNAVRIKALCRVYRVARDR